MNKKWNIFLTILLGASIFQPLCASAEAEKMYQDIMDTLVNVYPAENSKQRIDALDEALFKVNNVKKTAERRFIRSQDSMSAEELFCGGIFAGFGVAFLFAVPFVDPKKRLEGLFYGVLNGGTSLAIFMRRSINSYFAKKELAKLNEVIAKLEAAKIELQIRK